MNQEQVKEKLLELQPEVIDFTLIFSGKQSKKVNGMYQPEKREIIIHNRNFEDDNNIMYTAIHEFAHHIHFTTSPMPISSRSHTIEYWNIFHSLLERAEEMGLYQNRFDEDPEFRELTQEIKSKYIAGNGQLMKDFGSLLKRAEELCRQKETRFEDYIDRVLGLQRHTAKTMMRVHSLDLPTQIGYENMKTLVSIPKQEEREKAQEAFLAGKSPDMVKAQIKGIENKPDPIEELHKERSKIERTIENLQNKLTEIDSLIETIHLEAEA